MSLVFGINNIHICPPKYGKHKVPRFIYHITSRSNYNKLLTDGTLRMSEDLFCGQGVFASELNNIFKNSANAWKGKSLLEEIVKFTNKDNGSIVILKIPTSSLDMDKLYVRSHNIMGKFCYSDEVHNAVAKLYYKCQSLGQWKNYSKNLKKIYFKFLGKQANKNISNHLCQLTPAKDSNILKQRKHALEYIYKDNIPMSVVTKIGEVNTSKLRKTNAYDDTKPIKSLFSSLLEGTPEQKGTLFINY